MPGFLGDISGATLVPVSAGNISGTTVMPVLMGNFRDASMEPGLAGDICDMAVQLFSTGSSHKAWLVVAVLAMLHFLCVVL